MVIVLWSVGSQGTWYIVVSTRELSSEFLFIDGVIRSEILVSHV